MRKRWNDALRPLQSRLLLLQGMPEAELETNHKRACPVESAVERSLATLLPKMEEAPSKRASTRAQSTESSMTPADQQLKRALAPPLPKMEEAPKNAFCYICLEGEGDDGKSSKLMRGCACRGDSAGFVHLECLTKFAVSKEDSDDVASALAAWMSCINCKRSLTGFL